MTDLLVIAVVLFVLVNDYVHGRRVAKLEKALFRLTMLTNLLVEHAGGFDAIIPADVDPAAMRRLVGVAFGRKVEHKEGE